MPVLFRQAVFFGLLILWLLTPQVRGQSRQQIQFDSDWRFSLGDPAGAEKIEFSESNWRKLDLPHDWSIEESFNQKNPTGAAGGFLPAGIGWYRKQFTLQESQSQRRVFIDFDGVMANSDVWINGVHLGHRPYGYVSFRYELTPHLNFGQTPNVISVRVDNSGQPASRWYAGAGIYRHVRLTITDSVHIDHWGTFVTTPEVSAAKATVSVESTVVNQSKGARVVSLQISVLGPDGHRLQSVNTRPKRVSPNSATPFAESLTVRNPERWDLDHPAMYRVVVEVIVAGYEPDPRRIQVLFSDWSPKNIDAHEETVEVYSNCEQVELFLNGKSLGAKPLPPDASPRTWSVRFEPGTLFAEAKSRGLIAAVHALRTAGAPARIELTADRTRLAHTWDDVVHLTAKIVDKYGVLVPTANNTVSFSVTGPGFVAAVDNGDNSSHERFQASQRRVYQGLSFAMIKAKAARGRITITATAPGLESASVTLTAAAGSASSQY